LYFYFNKVVATESKRFISPEGKLLKFVNMAKKKLGETVEEKTEKKVRSKLSPYEWRLLRKGLKGTDVQNGLKSKLSKFKREFRLQLSTFITGAFAFVAALLWRDAISSFLNKYQKLLVGWVPIKEEWFVQFYTAFFVSIVAVVAIVLISKYMKPHDK